MNLRAGHASNVLSVFLLVLGLLVSVVAGSVIASGLSAVPLTLSGSEVPSFAELATQAMETDLWMITAEIIRGFACLGVVALLLVYFDRRPFRFAAIGIASRPNPGLMVLAGFLLMLALILGAAGVAAARGVESGVSGLSDALAETGLYGLIVLFIGAVANAFWQEVAFRGYVQDRLQRSYGVLPGIVMCSMVFVVLHGLARPLSMPEVITGTILFCLVGWLYFVSNSIALATALHATGNLYLRIAGEFDVVLPPHLDRGVAYSVGLGAVLVLFRHRLPVRPGTAGSGC